MFKRLMVRKTATTRHVRKIAPLIFLLLSACVQNPVQDRGVPPLQGHGEFPVARVDLLEVTPAMKAFVDRQLNSPKARENRAWALAYAALDPMVFEFEYKPDVTLTGPEAFEQRRGNCLTFSNMFIAMAREAGLDAWYREVEIAPEWSNANDTMLVSMHVNAAVRYRGAEYVIDVSRRREGPGETWRRLSDEEAEAQYYNNFGVDALLEEDLAAAHAWFSLALRVRPGLSYVWSNLGVVFKKNGQLDDAMTAYRTALDFNPRHAVSLNNLSVMYEEAGDQERADALFAQVERMRDNNPYYLHYLAALATQENEFDEAIRLLNRAIRLNRRDHRFYEALAQNQNAKGQTGKAERNLRKARSLVPRGTDPQSLTLDLPPPLVPEYLIRD